MKKPDQRPFNEWLKEAPNLRAKREQKLSQRLKELQIHWGFSDTKREDLFSELTKTRDDVNRREWEIVFGNDPNDFVSPTGLSLDDETRKQFAVLHPTNARSQKRLLDNFFQKKEVFRGPGKPEFAYNALVKDLIRIIERISERPFAFSRHKSGSIAGPAVEVVAAAIRIHLYATLPIYAPKRTFFPFIETAARQLRAEDAQHADFT